MFHRHSGSLFWQAQKNQCSGKRLGMEMELLQKEFSSCIELFKILLFLIDCVILTLSIQLECKHLNPHRPAMHARKQSSVSVCPITICTQSTRDVMGIMITYGDLDYYEVMRIEGM